MIITNTPGIWLSPQHALKKSTDWIVEWKIRHHFDYTQAQYFLSTKYLTEQIAASPNMLPFTVSSSLFRKQSV